MSKIDYSIVIPVYNSGSTLNRLFRELNEFFSANKLDFEVIFVNDFSTDDSEIIIQELKSRFSKEVKLLNLATNKGQHFATFLGLKSAKGKFVITIDDDLQVKPREIINLIHQQQLTNGDLIYGYFQDKKHGKLQNLGSWIVVTLISLIFKPLKGISSFRLIKGELIEKLAHGKPKILYLDILLNYYAYNPDCIEVSHYMREYGKSGYNYLKLFKLFSQLVIGIFLLKWFPSKLSSDIS
ncbi:MAG: glycosyltransferase [Flammeovirgaceae bacterium]|nr:glycosyltransferase [Flammeovirgaceae bacterium]